MENVRHDVDCFEQLGVSDPAIIPDGSFSASSNRHGMGPHKARLDGVSAWCPQSSDEKPTLSITLPDVNKHIYGIVAQGHVLSGTHLYAKFLRPFKDGNEYLSNSKDEVC